MLSEVPQYPSICNSTLNQCVAEEPDAKKRVKLVMYYPTASAFEMINGQEFGGPANWMGKYGDVGLVIGAGNQAYFGGDMASCRLDPGAKILTTPEKFKFTFNAKRLFYWHEHYKLPILFRGDFTWRAAKASGYNYGISMGCPSLMLNPHPDAGALLAKRYAALKKRIGDRTLRVAINVKNECDGFRNIFARILRDYPTLSCSRSTPLR